MPEDTNSGPSGLIIREDKTYTQRHSDRIDEAYDEYRSDELEGSTRLYRALISQARNIVCFRLRYLDEALAHDIATRALSNIGQFAGGSKFSTWFYTIAQNEVNRALEERITNRNSFIPIDTSADDKDGNEDRVAIATEPAAPLSGIDERVDAAKLIRGLSEAETTILNSTLTGYTLEEIADRTGEPLGTVRSRSERAKAKMRRKIRPRKQKE